jgi:hypothetical protein
VSEGETNLKRITRQLEELARQLADESDEERAAELIREASKLAADAGEEADRALREASTASDA